MNRNNSGRQPLYVVLAKNIARTVANRFAMDAVDFVIEKIKDRFDSKKDKMLKEDKRIDVN